MKKKNYIIPIACLALFLTLQAPSDARPDKGGGGHGPKPPAHSGHKHKPKPPRHHNSHINIHYRYSSPCNAHWRYDCYKCYHRHHRHHRGFFGSGLGFTIFL
ncbi:hypothetical protein IJC60_01300 [bacterium]|nr:hypothetical protein [bacterium]